MGSWGCSMLCGRVRNWGLRNMWVRLRLSVRFSRDRSSFCKRYVLPVVGRVGADWGVEEGG